VKNGTETDRDCGGGNGCAPCAQGLVCKVPGDCTSSVCTSGRCAAPTCSDSTKNQNETDRDCGGSCPKCAVGLVCGGNSDCASDNCATGRCAAPPFVSFGYVPGTFNPNAAEINPSATDPTTTLDCGVSTFDSNSLAFGNWCGRKLPTPDPQAQTNGPEVVVLPLRGLNIPSGSTLRITGTRPVVLAVFGDASIAGTIDASANGTTAGPGSNYTCGNSTGRNGGGGYTNGGGGGGGYATAGANGGSAGIASGGGAGTARANTIPPLYGGCPGGNGGGCNSSGGGGGGAIQISAAGNLTVNGTIVASGGQGQSCGGGGGSGGSILLEGNAVSLPSGSTLRAAGGRGGDAGSNAGGAGSNGTSQPGPGAAGSFVINDNGAGGGGSGGRGRIRGIASCAISATLNLNNTTACP
jgi:hypothetical protein